MSMFCRWTSCRCLFALTAGPRAVGTPVASVLCRCRMQPWSVPGDLCGCREPEKALGDSEGRRKAERPRQCDEARSLPNRAVLVAAGAVARKIGASNRYVSNPARSESVRDEGENDFHSTKVLFRGLSTPSSVRFRSAAKARRMPILVVIVMWMSKTIHGALHRLERTRGGVVIKPCEISVF